MFPVVAVSDPRQYARAIVRGRELGQIGVVDATARQNSISILTGLAMASGGIYALLNVPGAKKVTQVALGGLGGSLLLAGLLNIYDGID